MIADARVSYVAFTGSVAGGHAVQRAAAARFIPTGLELGGKDPAYVRADAPLPATVENLVDGAYFNSGQSCCAVERIYVDRRCYAQFVEAFVAQVRQYLGQIGAEDTKITHPTTTLEDLFLQIVKKSSNMPRSMRGDVG